MIRKIVCILSALGLVAGMRLSAYAQTGSIRVVPGWCGRAAADGTVRIKQVGRPVEGGYALTDGLADWIFWEEEVSCRQTVDLIAGANTSGGTTGAITGQEGTLFSNLEEGLYLVTQEEPAAGFEGFSPFLMTIPTGEAWDLTVNPPIVSIGEIPDTGDHPAPIVVAMGISFLVAVFMVLGDKRSR